MANLQMSPNPTPIPQSQVDQDLAAWAAAQAQKEQMQQQLQALLAMLAAIKDPQEAFMICMNQVLPGVMQVQDAGEGSLGYANFTSSDFQKEIMAIQALFNKLSSGDGTDKTTAAQLIQQINLLEDQLKAQLQKAQNDPNSTPMDKQDLETMINAIESFKGLFGNGSATSWGDAATVAQDIYQWSTDPTIFKEETSSFQELSTAI